MTCEVAYINDNKVKKFYNPGTKHKFSEDDIWGMMTNLVKYGRGIGAAESYFLCQLMVNFDNTKEISSTELRVLEMLHNEKVI